MEGGSKSSLYLLYRWFRKPKTTVIIILVLVLLFFAGLIVPQKALFESKSRYDAWIQERPWINHILDSAGFTDIYRSPLTLFLLGLFYLNLVAVVIERVPAVFRKALLKGRSEAIEFAPDELKRSESSHSIVLDDSGSFERVARFLRERTWFVLKSGTAGTILATKNRMSAFGFILFHISFLLCLTGGLLIYYTRFSGQIILTEGQAFEGDMGQFYRVNNVPKLAKDLPDISFRLEKLAMTFEQDRVTEVKGLARIRYLNNEDREIIQVNRPIRRGAITLLAVNTGVSPLFRIRSVKDGREIDGAWISLNVLFGREDSFRFESSPELEFRAKFFPDHVVAENGVETTRTLNIVNPAFHVTIRDRSNVIAEATIKQGQAMIYGTHMLEFTALRRWMDFLVVREQGSGILIAGFVFGVVGLIVRLVFYRKEIRAVLDGTSIVLDGKSEYYPHSFAKEMQELVDDLERYLQREEPK